MSGLRKILMVTRNFPPLLGGMERLNLNVYIALKKKYAAFLSGPKGSASFHDQTYYAEFPFKPLWLFILLSLIKTVSFALRIQPHMVFCGSGTSILAGCMAAKLSSAKLVCYLHGLDIVAPNLIYQRIFLPLIRKADLLIVNSRHTRDLALKAGIDSAKLKILCPGVSIPDMSDKQWLGESFRRRYGLDEGKFILIAGRITARKGIVEFIEKLFVRLALDGSDLKLVILGAEAHDAAKSSKGVTKAVTEAIGRHGLEEKIILTGSVSESEYSGALFAAEMLAFPVLELPNDVEGFGMVAIEAAAHGLPTIAFSVGGVPDAVADNESGWLVDPGNYAAMKEKIIGYLSNKQSSNVSSESCRKHAAEFSWRSFEKKLWIYLDQSF